MSNGRYRSYLRRAPGLNQDLPQGRKVAALLSDSKGSYLQEWVSNDSKDSRIQENIQWWLKSGRTTLDGLTWLIRKISHKQKRHGDLHIYRWLGSCDLTGKTGRFIFLKDTYVRESAILSDALEQFDQLARRKRFPITFFEIPYFSIVEYNRHHNLRNPEIFKGDDIDLKIALKTINEKVVQINERNGTHSPAVNYDLRRCRNNRRRRKKYYINYNVYRDGFHPDEWLSKYWLRPLCECI